MGVGQSDWSLVRAPEHGCAGARPPQHEVIYTPPSCAVLCGLIRTTISSLRAKFHTCRFIFPWHGATANISVSPHVRGTNNATPPLALLISFSQPNLGLSPSETLRPLMGENLHVHERHVRVLSVVHNKQNHHIPAACTQARAHWKAEGLPWRLVLPGPS